MKSLSNKLTQNAILVSASFAGILLTATQSNADVVFDDGQMHTISDDTYQYERIIVSNNSKLKIVDGAVISASISEPWDWNSGVEVLDYSGAAIQVFDGSMVIIQGGAFGGEQTGVPGCTGSPLCGFGFADNWYSGAIAAFDQSKVIVQDGTFGAGAFRSGALAMFDEARLIVSGGTFTNDGGSGGRIELFDYADGKISGGNHGSSIVPVNGSTLKISGGTFGKHDGIVGAWTRGSVNADGSARVQISGGDFGGDGRLAGLVEILGGATLKVTGGTFTGGSADFNGLGWLAGRIHVASTGLAEISGGWFNASTINVDAGLLEIEGRGFNLPYGNVTELSTPLFGTLDNGDPIDVTLTRVDSNDAIIELIED